MEPSAADAGADLPPTAPWTPTTLPVAMPLWMRPRDPFCVVVFWQADPRVLQALAARRPGSAWRLRVLGGEACQQVLGDDLLPLEADHRFVPVGAAGTRYVAEIGLQDADGSWHPLTRSAPVTTPVAAPTATWSRPSPAGISQNGVPSPATGKPPLPSLRRERHPDLRAATPSVESHGDRSGSSHLLWALVWEPTQPTPSPSSADLTQWISRLIPQPRAASGPGHFAPGAEDLAPPEAPSSAAIVPAPVRTFWFEVNAELVLYGRTERDARVTIGGRPIALRSDGSFRFQFSLPDGAYDLPVVAVNAAGDDGRSARLEFSRTTTLAGDVGVHPQDPALRPPAVESVH